jgi:hypothetical protein
VAVLSQAAVKQELLTNDDYFSAPGMCTDAGCRRLLSQIDQIAPHTDAAVKRMQRDDVMTCIRTALQWQRQVNVYLFDDRLPTADGRSSTLFTQELLQQFGGDRLRIWAPNLKADIVQAQQKLDGPTGWLTAGTGCWHQFNDRWAEKIRRAGGLDVVFADCFRGFEHGCGALMADLVQRSLIRRRTDDRDERHCALTFAVSDRYERTQGWSAATVVARITIELTDYFARNRECAYTGRVVSERGYGATMHYFTAVIEERQWSPRLPGFVTRVEHREVA